MSVRLQSFSQYAPGTSRKILDTIDLDVADGSFVALVGPSGAGKTTLLRAIAGLSPSFEGTLLIDGAAASQRPASDRNIGFVFQNYALFRHMSVARNISFGLDVLPRNRRPDRETIRQRVMELLDLIQLPHFAKARPNQLSGGQRQRVALARALATQPQLLLLDEPFGALDPIIRRQIRRWLRELHDRLGLTTILVTHDHEEALDIADTLVVMQNGQIVQSADAATLDHAPATLFVMQFLGETLQFKGEIRNGIFRPSERDVLPFACAFPEGPATAFIRPHAIRLKSHEGQARVRPGPHHPNGLYRYDVVLTDRTIEILSPSPPPTDGLVGLDITNAHFFP
ncbi:sulfate/molybdate ABC transporter ATP-binding protein [Gluconobacter morbifer]|uniref:Sulfate/thiosulfate import ATP-binding protein CysA n=1 Tax=Gluconobacter morbifer G707 TaxID=1088869 RepID=G6XHG5_9PROT|nr:sulfate/molybdate ABC transporter ATP-binding protein [Gluconobacter morbifer]EHH69623.1 sulfate/thiosulfate import ATP-binding protein CysA [Gluconobacter morbifer G707]